MGSERVVVVIPARYGSTRLPGKPLVSLAGLPMIQRVYERAKSAKSVHQVIVATDDDRIIDAVKAFGGQARTVEVAARQTAAGDIEFARHSDRHRLQAIVQDIDPRVPDRTPNRHELTIPVVVPRPRRHLDRCLGRTVEIDQFDIPGRRHFSREI